LFGTELDTPVVTDESRALNITNEGGYGSKVGFLKNITGLWLIQESRRHWNRHGNNYSYADLEALARKAEPFKCFINPDAPEFLPHGNIPGRIREFCQRTGQPVPESPGEVMRCIYESLAFKYRQTLESVEKCTGKTYPVIHIIGGGTKDTFLSGLTACSTGRKVISGPVEATVFGNLAVQLLSCGDIKSIEEARQVIALSEGVKQFMPENTDEWNKNYDKFLKIM
ncbi:MAG: rhamnulokinase, partial [Clostridia bacterium]|nr:rhamnulokinase [Clostridia bacterium]